MDELFNSDRFQLRPKPVPYFREEIFVSALDARRVGLSDAGQFCVFAIQPLFPGPREQEFAVHVAVDAEMGPGAVLVNQNFLDSAGIRPDDERFWLVKRAPAVIPVQETVIELVVEQGNVDREIENLRRQRRDLFSQRCLLVEPGQRVGDLTLPMLNRGYFNFRSVQPAPETIRSKNILIFDDNTVLNLFVPHRKSGVDMAIVVVASNSMDLSDYVDANGRVRSRIDGVRAALETLLQRRLASGSRVSRIAAIVFGANTHMLYPLQDMTMIEIKSAAQLAEIQDCIRNLSDFGLKKLKVDRNQTNISSAMRYATELLDYFAQEGNEKMMVLLSDGADWTEDTAGASEGEVVHTSHDPAVLADSLYYDSRVRIHTVLISNEQALRRYEDRKYWNQGWAIPNPALLRKIADLTDGLFIESPDARSLARLFDELGEGALYPV